MWYALKTSKTKQTVFENEVEQQKRVITLLVCILLYLMCWCCSCFCSERLSRDFYENCLDIIGNNVIMVIST